MILADFEICFKKIESGLLPLLEEKCKYEEEDALLNAPRFNVYRILNIHRKEAVTHTPMIAELLNPKGSHGQGNLFLKPFIDKVCFPTILDFSKNADWCVETERFTDYGRLDMVVSSSIQKCLIAIENKIDSGEQPDQLDRYCDWLNKQKQYEKRYMVFLTPTGHAPISFCKNKDSLRLIQLSYEEQMVEIFSQSLKELKSPRVRETVQQYIDLIKTIDSKGKRL
jgi:hypothetical protein